MDYSFQEENEPTTLVTQSLQIPWTAPAAPLSVKRSDQSLNYTGGSLSDSTPKKKLEQNLITLQRDYAMLERQYTDFLVNYNNLSSDYKQLEFDIANKNVIIKESSSKITNLEKMMKGMQIDYTKNKEMYEKEIFYYKELIEELQSTIERINNELFTLKEQHTLSGEMEERYAKLLKDFKILQSNYELEQNSKLVLIDQVEYLNKKNDLGLVEDNDEREHAYRSNHSSESSQEQLFNSQAVDVLNYDYNFDSDQSVINSLARGTMHDISDEDEVELDEIPSLSYLADDLENNHSSPIKSSDDMSLKISNNFQFPPSNRTSTDHRGDFSLDNNIKQGSLLSEQISNEKKRQSLPARPKALNLENSTEFVLSPLKLASQGQSYFEGDISIGKTKKRYSNTKPNHSRYNSHDIFPIKVEFEPFESNLRSTSVPEDGHVSQIEDTNESSEQSIYHRKAVRNSALCALNGYSNPQSNRHSILTSSSKSSSVVLENNLNEMTKQEIMKLKFELQSLKLHNEKLLSYIGFELQKQKKSIKRLSSKQSMNNLNKRMEYSDAKLIEKSRNMLIHKKRVLRSVSVNSILSKKYNKPSISTISKGLLSLSNDLLNNEFDFIKSENDEDDYGFLNHDDKFNKRIFSSSLHAYLNFNDLDDSDSTDTSIQRKIKKFKSQTFVHTSEMSSEHEDYEGNLDDIYEKSAEWEDISNNEIIEIPTDGMFHRVKYLLFGPSTSRKKTRSEELVDDGLKYKFFTITIGILIIGLKLSHKNNNTFY